MKIKIFTLKGIAGGASQIRKKKALAMAIHRYSTNLVITLDNGLFSQIIY